MSELRVSSGEIKEAPIEQRSWFRYHDYQWTNDFSGLKKGPKNKRNRLRVSSNVYKGPHRTKELISLPWLSMSKWLFRILPKRGLKKGPKNKRNRFRVSSNVYKGPHRTKELISLPWLSMSKWLFRILPRRGLKKGCTNQLMYKGAP